MKPYTLEYTSTSLLINAVISNNGFKETIQYEIKQHLSINKIDSVYNTLTAAQQDSINRNKRGFKQFIRAILLRHPVDADVKRVYASRNDEAKRMVCRVAGVLNIDVQSALNNLITTSTMRAGRYKLVFSDNDNTKYDETEKLAYNDTGDLIIVGSVSPVVRDNKLGLLYIYAIFTRPVPSK